MPSATDVGAVLLPFSDVWPIPWSQPRRGERVQYPTALSSQQARHAIICAGPPNNNDKAKVRARYSSLMLADVWDMREELLGLGDADDDDDKDRNVGWSEERATSAPLSTPTEAIRRDVKPPRSGGGSTGVAKQYIDVNLFGFVASALLDTLPQHSGANCCWNKACQRK